ncbi:MAG: ATP synthase F0 subunit C [Candidatus Electrothrix sp. ATG1]|nr:ATP synthase F0 subunit C [Candidatus Electrothrix sp. ATG1]MCI5208832.1 ATP synthase F0 subunit C [Candidatus Electrothrix sp. ATG2]
MDKIHLALICFAAATSIGLAGLGAGVGMGRGVEGACLGISRNPEAKGVITTTMILGLALIESIAIYGLVIAFILLYANPFKDALIG